MLGIRDRERVEEQEAGGCGHKRAVPGILAMLASVLTVVVGTQT